MSLLLLLLDESRAMELQRRGKRDEEGEGEDLMAKEKVERKRVAEKGKGFGEGTKNNLKLRFSNCFLTVPSQLTNIPFSLLFYFISIL